LFYFVNFFFFYFFFLFLPGLDRRQFYLDKRTALPELEAEDIFN